MNIAIIGTGLIGGSMALALKTNGFASYIMGVDANSANAEKALTLGIADEITELTKAITQSDLIILAVPVDACLTLLPFIMNAVNSRQVVLDTGSTKLQIIKTVAQYINRGRFVATHPMWGTEFSGPEAATINAFKGRANVICDSEDSDKDAVHLVQLMYESLGMYNMEMTAAEHDIHVAYTSHISHITSFALANTVLKKEQEEDTIFKLASGGFESTVRLAKSSPDMWVPILKQNRENVLDVLEEHIYQLMEFRTALQQEDWPALSGLMIHANEIRRVLDHKQESRPLPINVNA
jgi:prephenate dehydrogenase